MGDEEVVNNYLYEASQLRETEVGSDDYTSSDDDVISPAQRPGLDRYARSEAIGDGVKSKSKKSRSVPSRPAAEKGAEAEQGEAKVKLLGPKEYRSKHSSLADSQLLALSPIPRKPRVITKPSVSQILQRKNLSRDAGADESSSGLEKKNSAGREDGNLRLRGRDARRRESCPDQKMMWTTASFDSNLEAQAVHENLLSRSEPTTLSTSSPFFLFLRMILTVFM